MPTYLSQLDIYTYQYIYKFIFNDVMRQLENEYQSTKETMDLFFSCCNYVWVDYYNEISFKFQCPIDNIPLQDQKSRQPSRKRSKTRQPQVQSKQVAPIHQCKYFTNKKNYKKMGR